MGYINIFISAEQNVIVKNGQLTIGVRSLPVEEINCLIVDNLRTTLTTYAIHALGAAGATVIICDEQHMPSEVILPYQGYYRRLDTLELQSSIPRPRVKQLWQQIVRRKILGQSETLAYNGFEDASAHLEYLAKQVVSNDADNREAEAARVYFRALFGEDFARGKDLPVNGMLNYAYAVVRSLLARHLCARGFECAFGVFHHSKFNEFNLVDDIFEPFRPIIDCYVVKSVDIFAGLTPEVKRKLVAILELEVYSGDNYLTTLSYAVERLAESLLAYYKHERDDLCMPRLAGIKYHSYE